MTMLDKPGVEQSSRAHMIVLALVPMIAAIGIAPGSVQASTQCPNQFSANRPLRRHFHC
jgi:hypothetical protein